MVSMAVMHVDGLTNEDLRVVDPGFVAVEVEGARAFGVLGPGGMYGGLVWLQKVPSRLVEVRYNGI